TGTTVIIPPSPSLFGEESELKSSFSPLSFSPLSFLLSSSLLSLLSSLLLSSLLSPSLSVHVCGLEETTLHPRWRLPLKSSKTVYASKSPGGTMHSYHVWAVYWRTYV